MILNTSYNKQKIEEERKMKKILQVNFKVKATGNMTPAQVEQAFLQRAQAIANVKGFLWKIYLFNEAEKSAGGIYLFKDDASVQAYLKGEIFAASKSNPIVSDFAAKAFDILPECTKITRGPVD
jgi:hypothetical protein